MLNTIHVLLFLPSLIENNTFLFRCIILVSKVRNKRKKRLASPSLPLQPEPRSRYQKVDNDYCDDNDQPEIQKHRRRHDQHHRQYHSRQARHHQHSQNDFSVTSQESYSIKRTLVLQEERVCVVQKVIN